MPYFRKSAFGVSKKAVKQNPQETFECLFQSRIQLQVDASQIYSQSKLQIY